MNLDTMSYEELDALGKQKLDELGKILTVMENAAEREEQTAKTKLHAGLRP